MKTSPRFWFVSSIAVICLAALYYFIVGPFLAAVASIPTGDDAEHSYSLWLCVTNKVHFDGRSVIEPDKPPVFSSPRNNGAVLGVYGVTNTERQDKVLSVVREWQASNPSVSKIDVKFYERENWRLFTNNQTGDSGGNRLAETLLREEVVK